MKTFPITSQGYAALRKELDRLLKIERPQIIQQIERARGLDTDPAESSELQSAKEAQELNEARIAELEDKLAHAEVIDLSKLSGTTVTFGAKVTIVDEDTGEKLAVQIVGESESDVRKGRISCMSPVARSLIGQRKGAVVEVATPSGAKVYEITQLKWG